MSNKSLVKNTGMLFLLNIAKLIFPFLTLPYLTRVLSVDGYAMVAYVKSVMQYMQLLVDFGFMLSATKAIVNVREDKKEIGVIVGNTIFAKLILSTIAFGVLILVSFAIPLLRQNLLYVYLSFVVVFLSSFLVDYLFRGLEQMQEITIRFVVMKGISTLLTFFVVRSDGDLLLIPILDIISSVIAIVLVWKRTKVYGIMPTMPKLAATIESLKDSFQYFVSNIATTAFGALNTLLIGIFLPAAQIALWTVALQIISAVQVMYNPIIDGIYPEMVKTKSKALLKKLCFIFMPIVFIGCIAMYALAELAVVIVAGTKYLDAVPFLRALIPVLFFSFPAMLFGWPALGAIGKVRETSISTVLSAIIQCSGLCGMIVLNCFNLMNIAFLRCITEACLLVFRLSLLVKNKKEFN